MKIHYYAAKNNIGKLRKRIERLPIFINKQAKTIYFTPLMLAVQNGHIEMVSFLLREGANIYLRSKGGQDVFHVVCYKILSLEPEQRENYYHIIELLLKH